jgi:diguanylate cyclase (GGDEF)-like protein/PAS domain S-box-containing protein
LLHLLHHLIGRLSVSRKLILIYALDLSAVIFVSTILINEKYIAINFARQEIVGNAYISEIRAIVLPQVRRPSSEIGAPSPAARLLQAEEHYGKSMGSRELAAHLAAYLEAREPLSDEQKHAKALALQALITRIGNQSNLILDPDLDSYYSMSLVVLRFPELFDLCLRIGNKAIEVGRAATPALRSTRQTEYLILEGRIDAVASGIAADFDEAIAAGQPALKASLGLSRDRLLGAIEHLRSGTRRMALDLSGEASPALIRSLGHVLEDTLSQSWKEVGMALDALLDQRISALFARMWWHLGAAGALLMLILVVVFFVARMIALPIRRLSDVAGKVSVSADYALRAEWSSGDELGRLVNAFNQMLAQLDRSRRVEQELAVSARAAEAQRELLEAIPIPLLVTAIPQHEVLHANLPAQEWLHDLSPDPWIKGLDRPQRVRFFQQLADRGGVNDFEALWDSGGVRHWVLLSARRLVYQDQDAVLTAITPIERLKQMEKRLALWAKVFEASSESIMITNAEREIVTVNRAFCRASAYELSEIVGEKPDFLRSERHPPSFFDQIWEAARVRGSWQGELWFQRKNGDSFPAWAVLNAVRETSGTVSHYVATILDISERKENERRISHLAHHDTLTDLPNRALCLDRLTMAIQQSERTQRRVGLLFLDVDHFKSINDSLGHPIGDGLLRSLAQRLLEAVRAGDTVSRLGGDEFVIIFNGVVDAEEISEIVNSRLIPLLRQPHDVDGAHLQVSCSVGIAVYPDDGRDVDVLMRNADAAMYQAKQQGRNTAQFFTAEMDRSARERIQIEQDLHCALERDELRLYYQPRVDSKSGQLLGVEALIRWQHATHGLISPAYFIPVAEECGLIVQIGYWVFSEACRQQAEWRATGVGDIPVSVNLSVAQFRDENMLDVLKATMLLNHTNPGQIELELTESLLMENVESTIKLLDGIKGLGLMLSVDDFGTGYSSLNYLHRFPIDKLKIDRSFVMDMLDNPKDLAVTQAIISLGHTLGLGVVAEGVENTEQRMALSAAGCDELQGYYFSKPIPADQLMSWMSSQGQPWRPRAERPDQNDPKRSDSSERLLLASGAQ